MATPARVMLDTNMASYLLRGEHGDALRAQLHKVPPRALCVSSISAGELHYGLARKPNATRLAKTVAAFLQQVEVLPWDAQAARVYGTLRATLEAAGKPLGNLDMLIAAHAVSAGALLVTHDRAFGQVSGLNTADWIAP